MLKSILSLSITAAFGLLVFAIIMPGQVNTVAQKVLGEVVTVNNAAGVSGPANYISSKLSTILSADQPTVDTSDDADTDNSPFSAANIIDATNEERVEAGLPPLKTNPKLAESAKLKVEDMIQNDYFEHTSPSGKTVADLGHEVGYDYVVMGENLALGNFSNVNDLLQAWMNSPGHRANILNTSYQDMGAYAAQGMYQGHEVWFAVQHFGTQREVCPALDASLKTTIDTTNASIAAQETTITALRTQIEDPNHVQGTAYSDMITTFNSLVATYNADLSASQENITAYNKQVMAFNTCLSQYQTSIPSDQ
jgi:uncharacterized protein YkwD